MERRLPRTGLCVLRIEEQDSYLLISVAAHPDLWDTGDATVLWSADEDEAIEAVRAFLRTFTGRSPGQ